MFTHRIFNDNILFAVKFSDYAKRHYLKRFEKEYRVKQWGITVESMGCIYRYGMAGSRGSGKQMEINGTACACSL